MTILHLEDSENDAIMIAALLQEEWPDCRIRRVKSRAEFESALEFEQFDLIVSDHHMPGFDGVTALQQAKLLRSDKPFIFMSGTIGEERAIDAIKQGATDYVIKDRPARLVAAVRQALGRVEDTARRQRMEEALRQNQERFRQIAENVEDLIAMLDLEGRRVYGNPAYAHVLGDVDGAWANLPFEEVHPEDRERVRQEFAATVDTGRSRRLEYRFQLPDGAVRIIESQWSVIRRTDGNVANVLLVSRDVTDRRAAELQLQEQASLLDKARDAIIATDLSHRVAYWNLSAERIYGCSSSDTFGVDLRSLGLHAEPERFAEAHAQLLARGEWQGEFQVQSRRGEKRHIATTWSLVLDATGRPRTVLMIDTDITEAKQMQTQLLRAQRAESVGALTSGIAHDLNNMLSPILMGIELLKTEPLNESAVRALDTMESSAEHGAALVRQLLSFARGTDGPRVPLQPRPLLRQLGDLLRQALPRPIALRLKIAEELPPIRGDATQLKQLFLNLCLNARDAMPDGGSITVTAEQATLDESQARRILDGRAGRYLHVAVADSGAGIPPEMLDRIFDPFFTTKPSGKGTGLGLSLVRGIVKGHEGFLHVESALGSGTTFHIYLPVLSSDPNPPPAIANTTP